MLINQPLINLSQAEFMQLVNSALKSYHSVLALARSPLADSPLVHPLLVLDDVSPTADERGNALRLLLQWAVMRLAPEPATYPLGTERPYVDPTWRDPRWWRYTILRHRYLEPLHPDEFIDGGRFTETLVALTGLTSSDAFFDERNRAIREVAQRLQEQLTGGKANEELQALALDEVLRPLERAPQQFALLGIAATFDDVFPRSLLLRMAVAERLDDPAKTLDMLTGNRYLLMGDGGSNLWLSPVLQRFVYARQIAGQRRQRHLAAAHFYRGSDEVLNAAVHYRHAEEWATATTLLLDAAPLLIDDLQTEELLVALALFTIEQMPATLWCELQLLLTDLNRRQGHHDAALAACRQALRVAVDDGQQGQLYWRMGKLYEKRNQLQALGYYEQALTRLGEQDLTLVELLKDRSWLYILRQEWSAAEDDLQRALTLIANRPYEPIVDRRSIKEADELRANLLDALAHLHLEQQQYTSAIDYARQSLLLRETTGDLLQVAKSFNNLGNFYSRMGEVEAAIDAHNEAIQLYQRLNNQELEAEAWLNQGVVYHTAGWQREALAKYHNSLSLSQRLGLLLAEVTAHSNLAEAHAELGEQGTAVQHWRFGVALSKQAGFDDELHYLEELCDRFGFAGGTEIDTQQRAATISAASPIAPPLTPRALLSPDELAVLTLAEREGQATPRLLMERLHVSKATATRRLTGLTDIGLLVKRGKGRGTVYLPVKAQPVDQLSSVAPGVEEKEGLEMLQELVGRHLTKLTGEYQVTELALLRIPDPAQQMWRLGVRFQAAPTVTQFFALEQVLRRSTD